MNKIIEGILPGIAIVFSLLAMPCISFSSDPYQPEIVDPLSESWRWHHFPELEGKGVRYMAQAGDRKVWVSYNEGVLEYDGYSWKTHNAENGLLHSPVEQLLVTSDSRILATTSSGIFVFNGRKWEWFFQVPDELSFIFHRIEELSDGSIMACADWGFLHFSEHGMSFYTSPAKIEQLGGHFPNAEMIALPKDFLNQYGDFMYASDILEMPDGRIWFALTTQTEKGKLLKFRPGSFPGSQISDYELIDRIGGKELGEDQKMLLARDGNIWIINSTSNKGIFVYDGHKWGSIHLNDRFGGDEYMSEIIQTRNGTIWISSMARIFAWKEGEWELYQAPHYPIPANRVILKNGQDDQIWVAGYKSKVLLLDFSTEQWVTWKDLSFQFEDGDGSQWFLEADNRVVHRKGDKWTAYGTADGLMDAPIKLITTSEGQIWAAGSHKNVAATALYSNGKWELHTHPQLSWGIDYRSVFEAEDGTLWFGGSVDAESKDGFLSGLLELKDPQADELEWKHHISSQNGLGQANVYGIGESGDGRIWIGGSRLYYYDGKSWNTLPDERLQQYINTVHSTEKLLLVGSRYYGLFVFDGKSWDNYNTTNGMCGNTIISIDALSDSSFIIATENDICRFDGKSWTSNVFPPELNMDFEGGSIVHTADNNFWINHVPRSWKRRAYSGKYDHPTTSKFFTTRYVPNKLPPETHFDYYLESVPQRSNSLVSWKGRDYFSETPEDNMFYSYRIDGGEWSAFSNETRLTFTGIASGTHRMEVRARDLDFNIDPSPASIEFRVMPPIWRQGWFIILIGIFLIIFGFYEYRVLAKKRKLEVVNASLQKANLKLQDKGRKIETQNREILAQQRQILDQAKVLEHNNEDLEARNYEIRMQRDKLEEMVEQIENLSKAKLAFFTNISHELRTPLTLILGPVMQLQNEGSQLSGCERKRLYTIIKRNASRLLKLINQLLEMRRIEHSALELNLSEAHLPEYVDQIIELFNGLAIKRDIHLSFDTEAEQGAVSLDKDKTEKVLVNLISNAFKHTPDGGSIQLRLQTVPAHSYNLNPVYERYFEIAVEDTGKGMSEELIELIFEKYYTTGGETMDSTDSGIGLSYIKDLLLLMQGDIRVESKEGRGTTFYVYLPWVPVKEQGRSREWTEQSGLIVARQEAGILLSSYEQEETMAEGVEQDECCPQILIVEDNPDMLAFLENILKRDYRILKAENGKEGLQLAKKHSMDLIISDVMMPEMDGIAFCEKLKNEFITSHIPVILLTAKVLDESKLSGFLKGADDYITKPFNPDILKARVKNLLDQREKLREVFNREFMLTPKVEKITSPDQEFLHRLVEVMNENLVDSEFNVNKMCRSMHLSHMHFIRKVKQLTGKKPVDLLTSFRLRKARELLATQNMTISRVAYEVGYDLPNSFSRAFKREFDMTPTQYVHSLSTRDISKEDNLDEIFSIN